MAETLTKLEKRKADFIEKKIKAAEDPASIFLHTKWAFIMQIADRLVTLIRKNYSISPGGNEAYNSKSLLMEFERINSVMWGFVFHLSPELAITQFNPSRWRELNDEVDRKRIYAKRKVTSFIIPSHEVVAQMSMAAKIIGQRMFEKKQTARVEELDVLITEQMNITKEVTAFMIDMARKANAGDDIKRRLKMRDEVAQVAKVA